MNMLNGVVRIMSDRHIGTGFVVTEEGLIATCAHVLGKSRPEKALVVFQGEDEAREVMVLEDGWRGVEAEDVALLKVNGSLPVGVKPLSLGSSKGTEGHALVTFGYPEVGEVEGARGTGIIVGHGAKTRAGQPLLQLHSSEITEGFSGGPVWDEVRHRVVGMTVIAAQTDALGKLGETAFATPTETLRTISSALQVSDVCPYRNLKAFTEADAVFFRGRQRIIETLVENLENEPRFLAVFGASGSGKSSVVQAGLIPRLRTGVLLGSDYWNIIVTRPTDPFFRQHLAELDGASSAVVLVIDQFEELFVSYDETASSEVMTQLIYLLEHSAHVTLLIVMRDDFYSLLVRQGQKILETWLKSSIVNVWQTLKREEVESIIREPAELLGWQFEEGLVETIVDDVLATAAKGQKKAESSTILPLLEFTLTQLWERQQDGILTHEAYHRLGGVTGGLKQWAMDAYYAFEERLRPLVRRIFTDLVYLGDEEQHIADSRRLRTLSTLMRSDAERMDVSQIIQRLVADRLLVTSHDEKSQQETIEIIHDALLWEWGLLKRWVEEDHTFLRWYQTLERQAEAWAEKRDKDKLLRGSDLLQASEYLDKRRDGINQLEREFIQASQQRKRFEQQRRALVIGGGVAALGLALIGGPTATTIVILLNTTVFEKQNLLKSIETLKPGGIIGEYKRVFGDPKFMNLHESSLQFVNQQKSKEYVFVTKYFYLSAVTDLNDVIKYFAVTIRDKTFNPTFQSPDYPVNDTSFKVTLGISKFKDVRSTPLSISGCVGMHDVYYHEIHYLGNPGNYEQFGFGLNEAGYLANGFNDFIDSMSKINLCYSWKGSNIYERPTYTEHDFEILKPMREKTVFNTYAISAPLVSIENYNPNLDLGVLYSQVRTL